MRMQCNRALAATAAAAIALTSATFAPAAAGPMSKQNLSAAQAGEMEFSAKKRMTRGDRAMLGAVMGVFGTIAMVAAANAARDRYYRSYPRHHYYAPPQYHGYRHHGYRHHYYYR